MKRTSYYIPIYCLILVISVQFSACDNNENTSPTDPDKQFRDQVSATWTLQQALHNGADVTAAFPNLTLTINTDFGFTVTNPVSPIWPREGTYSLEKDPTSGLYTIIRNDGREMQVKNVTASLLEINMHFDPSSGRTKSTQGELEFLFVK